MTIYYVDPVGGSDANAGTNQNAPIKSPNKTNLIASLVSGDSILMLCGTTWYGTVELWRNAGGGSAGSPITLGSYGSGALPVVDANNAARCVDIAGATSGYWVIENLDLTNATEAMVKNGSSATTGNIIVRYCLVHGSSTQTGNRDGVYLFGVSNKIIANKIYDIGNDAIFMAKGNASDGTGIEIAYNRIENISTRGTNGDCIQFSGEVGGSWVHHNWLDHSNVDEKQCIIQSGATSSLPSVWEDNTLIGPNTATTALHKPIYTDQPAIVRRNRIIGGIIGIDLGGTSSSATSNIITSAVASTDYSGIRLGAAGQVVTNNTIVGSASQTNTTHGINHFNAAHTGCSIRNNVVTGFKFGIRHHPTASVTETNNDVYSCGTAIVDNSYAAQAAGSGTITTDAVLDSNFMPTIAGVITGGVYLGGLDFNGKEFSATMPIGAMQLYANRSTVDRTAVDRTASDRFAVRRGIATA